MKLKKLWLSALLIPVLTMSAFVMQNGGTVKGKVTPAENATRAFVISGTDTAQTTITNGYFELKQLKEGVYQLHIEATPPYKHKAAGEIQVKEGETTDVGDIQLEQ